MTELGEYFTLKIATDAMTASLEPKQAYMNNDSIKLEEIRAFLLNNKISFGLVDDNLERIANGVEISEFPITVARGIKPENGSNGRIQYEMEQHERLEQDQKRNFRDIIVIPSIKEGEKIAQIMPPTNGKPGRNVFGKKVEQMPGKPIRIRPGKNVKYDEKQKTFYALVSGQLTKGDKVIHVYPLYEVNGDLSLKTGNVSFVGSVTIHGNVPSGYSVEAEGDIKIHGLVEAATIKAGGNVFITEGMAGMKKGSISAGLDVRIGYINQGHIDAGRDIFVENSIVHSNCVSKGHIYCQNGHIIGGSLSAGETIEARDVGNRMNTKTEIAFGVNKKLQEVEVELQKKIKEITENKQKLVLIGDRLKEKKNMPNGLTPKEKILLLKQRHSLEQSNQSLQELEAELNDLHVVISDNQAMKLIVKDNLYPNVELTFNKYKRSISSVHKYVQVFLIDKEITIQSL